MDTAAESPRTRLTRRSALGAGLGAMVLGVSGAQLRGTSAPPTPPRVRGRRQVGMTIPSWEADGYGRPELAQILDGCRAVGVGRIILIATWYQSGVAGSNPAPTEATPTDGALRTAASAVAAAGFELVLKPHIDLPDDRWRGDIDPGDRDAWFGRYTELTEHYAALAEELGAVSYVVGTELKSLSTDPRWAPVITTARHRFSGTLTYAANWDEIEQVTFWRSLDEIGVDAYYPLSSKPGGERTVRALMDAWSGPKRSLRKVAAKYQRPLRFTEIGYTRRHGTTFEPWNFELQTPQDDIEQAAAYRAVFRAWSPERWWAGADFWATDPPAEEHDPLGYSPLGHLAAKELADGSAALRGKLPA